MDRRAGRSPRGEHGRPRPCGPVWAEMHRTIVNGFAEEALRQQDGWIYILDGRTPTPQGAVPPEDISGAFEVSPPHDRITSAAPRQVIRRVPATCRSRLRATPAP